MTRKRFIKLLMAHGYQNREAEFAAWCALSEYGEYRLAWNNKWHALAVMRRHRNALETTWEALCDGFRNVLESIITPMADLIRETMRPLTDALYEALNGREREGEPYE